MHFNKLVLSIILATGVTSFTIPENATNGLWSSCNPGVCPDGPNDTCKLQEVHTRIGDLPSPAEVEAFMSRLARVKRDFAGRSSAYKRNTANWDSKAKCHTEEGLEDLDHQSTDTANAALDVRSGTDWVQAGCNFYAISDCVVAYMCNEGGDNWRYSSADHKYAIERITYDCGAYKPGTIDYKHMDVAAFHDTRKSIGYESYCTSYGHSFCGSGTN